MTSAKLSPIAPVASGQDHNGRSDPRERWSCLMDGEADEAMLSSCLREWSGNAAARRDWAIWHAAGDALRSSDVAAFQAEDFSARFAAALAAEPAIIARPRINRRLITRVMLPGAAVAAAAAMLTVVALPVLRGSVESGQLAQSVQSIQAAKNITNVSGASGAVLPAASTVAVNTPPPHIDSYIAAHRELAGSVGMAGTTPYLRTTTVLPER
jgi:negative regulator of sigma E activity